MQLPSIERTQNLRLSGADVASSGANRVIPLAPVNPSVSAHTSIEPTPGVVNMVNPALQHKAQPTEGEPVFTSVPDPLKTKVQEVVPHDWTIHRPAAQKVENPPPKPIAQVLMDHLRTMWTASASAIQIEQVKNHVTPAEPAVPTQVPGDLAKQILTYQPAKIKKTENL
ncbi:MAG: hypothetical protein RL302_2801 [Pseudomonadota bacterium]|jgi:hypothetical protein